MICFHYIRAFWLWVILQSPFSLFLAQFKSNTKYALGTCWRTPARNLGVVPDVWCRNKRKLAISNICLEEEFLMVVVEVLVWYKNNLCSRHRIPWYNSIFWDVFNFGARRSKDDCGWFLKDLEMKDNCSALLIDDIISSPNYSTYVSK